MAGLLWPGDHRAGERLGDRAVLLAMLRVETAWLATLAEAGVAPPEAAVDLGRCVGEVDPAALAVAAEAGGNPVIPLVALARERLAARHPAAAWWTHRGLTSQDVMDTALVLELRAAADAVLAAMDAQVRSLVALALRHRADPMAGRTLTQHAVPITFGLKAAQWLHGVLDARDDLRAARDRLPAQFGGAAGTLAAVAELLRRTGAPGDPLTLTRVAAARLDLPWAPPWHTARAPLTRLADALTSASDAWGHLAADVLVLARPEIAELAEPAGHDRGGSSTMPHKANPVLSVLIRRTALTCPQLAAQLHLAAATTVDERPDGAWHTEWSPLAQLARHTLTAADQTAELLAGLHVDTTRMARRARESSPALLAERHGIADHLAHDHDPAADRDPAADHGGVPTGDPTGDRDTGPEASPRSALAADRDPAADHLAHDRDSAADRAPAADHIDPAVDPARYLGSTDAVIDLVVERGRQEGPR